MSRAHLRKLSVPAKGGRHDRDPGGSNGVSRRFGGIQAVDDVSFALKEGEIVALIGPNGAGKTTLVNLMTGVHPALAGRIRFRGPTM